MTDNQQKQFEANRRISEDLELELIKKLRIEEDYLNSIACPSKSVMSRSARIQELIKLLA